MGYLLKSWTQQSLWDHRIFCDSVKTPIPAEVMVFIACFIGSLVCSTQEIRLDKIFPSEAKICESMRVVQFTDSSSAWPLYGYIRYMKSVNGDVGFVPKKTCHQKMHNHYIIRWSGVPEMRSTVIHPSSLKQSFSQRWIQYLHTTSLSQLLPALLIISSIHLPDVGAEAYIFTRNHGHHGQVAHISPDVLWSHHLLMFLGVILTLGEN